MTNGLTASKSLEMSSSLSPILATSYVACGGAIGAACRYQLGRSMMNALGPSTTIPWPTFAANVLGGLAMGLLFGWLAREGGASETQRLFLGVGLLGGFTTFSAFSLEMLQLIERGQAGMAIGYAMISVIMALAALYIGLSIVRVAT